MPPIAPLMCSLSQRLASSLAERLHRDARLTQDVLQRARSDAAMRGDGDAQCTFREANVRASLPDKSEAEPLQPDFHFRKFKVAYYPSKPLKSTPAQAKRQLR